MSSYYTEAYGQRAPDYNTRPDALDTRYSSTGGTVPVKSTYSPRPDTFGDYAVQQEKAAVSKYVYNTRPDSFGDTDLNPVVYSKSQLPKATSGTSGVYYTRPDTFGDLATGTNSLGKEVINGIPVEYVKSAPQVQTHPQVAASSASKNLSAMPIPYAGKSINQQDLRYGSSSYGRKMAAGQIGGSDYEELAQMNGSILSQGASPQSQNTMVALALGAVVLLMMVAK